METSPVPSGYRIFLIQTVGVTQALSQACKSTQLGRRQFEFLFEKPDLRIGTPRAKYLATRQGRRHGTGTVPHQAPAAGEILARETGILKKAPRSRAFGCTAE